jgi:predicted esterase
MRSLRHAIAILCFAGTLAPFAHVAAEDTPFPAGTSSHEMEGLRCSVVMPAETETPKARSLVVILHGNGGTETGMAGALEFLSRDGYCVLAPKSKGLGWETADLVAVRKITGDLLKKLRVGEGRLHGIGFSNGGWNLEHLVFDEKLPFASACWVAAGHRGRNPPDRARKSMGTLALVGETDGNRTAAEATPGLLEEKVRSTEVRIEPGIGHEWPKGQMEYYGWWLGVQEGRFVPGATLAFLWKPDDASAVAAMESGRTGGFVYWFDSRKPEDPLAKTFQNEVMQDSSVRLFGARVIARKMDRALAEEAFTAAKLKETPAIVVLDRKGAVVKSFQGKIAPAALAQALRSVAADKSVPK